MPDPEFAHNGVDHAEGEGHDGFAPPVVDDGAAFAPPEGGVPPGAGNGPVDLPTPPGGNPGAGNIADIAPPEAVTPADAAGPDGVAAGSGNGADTVDTTAGGGAPATATAGTAQAGGPGPAVNAGGEELPFTGAESIVLLACAFMLLASGVIFRFSARRRAAAAGAAGSLSGADDVSVDVQFAWRNGPPGMA